MVQVHVGFRVKTSGEILRSAVSDVEVAVNATLGLIERCRRVCSVHDVEIGGPLLIVVRVSNRRLWIYANFVPKIGKRETIGTVCGLTRAESGGKIESEFVCTNTHTHIALINKTKFRSCRGHTATCR